MQERTVKYTVVHRDDWKMTHARTAAWLSTDYRRPIGVAIFDDNILVGKGSNQATVRWPWLNKKHVTKCIRKMLRIKSHSFYWICPGCALFKNHAEARALRAMGPMYKPRGRVTMYLFGHRYCCDPCLEKVLAAGIDEVFITDDTIR